VSDRDLTRRALAVTALGGLTLPVLAACGGGGSSSSTTATDPDTGSGASKNPSGGGKSQQPAAEALVGTAQVPVGGGVILGEQNVVVTQPSKGTFEGFSATCTHEGCILASVAGGTINCGCHGSQFAITDGANVAGPNGSPAGSVAALPKVGIKVQGPNVVKT
jgi:nitrite reductase/ring-hydroxylating ferredoxin subunit